MQAVRLSRFVDTVRVRFRGGRGGDGCISMLHLFANEMAGPSGGNGGNGGHVVLRADASIKSLNAVASQYFGEPGEHGSGKGRYGKSAEHTFVPVPVGTLVLPGRPTHLEEHEHNPDESDILAELDEEGSMFIAARGGAGGRGNETFLSNKNRHPLIAERGAEGEINVYELRMKFYAHVALIGLPNVGKSSLLRSLTGAQVKVGNYAFTTLHPQVGVIEYEDYTQLTISDLPGLVEEAHKNRGLGLKFLNSLGRCSCFLYVIDMCLDPVRQLELLVAEVSSHNAQLATRPSLVLGNKMDQTEAVENVDKLRSFLQAKYPHMNLVLASAQCGSGLQALKGALRRVVEEDLRNKGESW